MEAKVLNKSVITLKDIMIGNFVIHRFLSIFYTLMFAFFLGYTIYNWDLLLMNMQSLIMGVALLILSGGVGFIWPILKALIWHIRRRGQETIMNYYFYDLSVKVENSSEKGQFKLEYKDLYKVMETKSALIFIYGSNKYIYIKKSGFNKSSDIDKVKGYLKRFNLVRK